MNWVKPLHRWTMKSIHAAILGSALLGSACIAFAQAPAAAMKLPKHFTKSQSFDLPVDMKQEFRLTLSEIRLYMRTPSSGWKLVESQPPHATRFNCKVAQDGEYWFSLATVDRMGRMTPADVAAEPPNQRVVIDSTPPVIQAQVAATGVNEFNLRCIVEDANADHGSLKAYQKTEFGDVPLEQVPGQVGVFLVKDSGPQRSPIVISVRDVAGNMTVKEVSLADVPGITSSVAKSPVEVSQAGMRPEPKDPPVSLPPPRFDPPVGKPDASMDMKRDLVPPRVDLPMQMVEPVNPKAPTIDDGPMKMPNPPATPVTRPSGPLQLINTTHAAVEYRLDPVGASGIGKIEIYMTPDGGQTWHRLGEDLDKVSPANINLPGDGVFGIRIVVTNGNGFGGKAPIRGDAPHCTIEVDSTSPFVQLRPVEVLASTGQVELRWNAQDKNLASEPISLSYRTRPDGPWLEINKKVQNDGMYRWTFPRDIGPQVYFRVEVTDQAGNRAQDISRQPVLIDVNVPQATVVGVTGSTVPR